MTTGFSPAAAALPDDLLTVTTRRVAPDEVVLAVRGEVDLSEVGFLGAAGLTVLVNGRAAAAGGDLCLVARTRVVLLPLTITGLDHVFDIYPKVADALLAAGAGPDG